MSSAIYSVIEHGKISHFYSYRGGRYDMPILALQFRESRYPDRPVSEILPTVHLSDLYKWTTFDDILFPSISEPELKPLRAAFGRGDLDMHVVLDMDNDSATFFHNSSDRRPSFSVPISAALQGLRDIYQKAPRQGLTIPQLEQKIQEKLKDLAQPVLIDPLAQIKEHDERAESRALVTVIDGGERADFYSSELDSEFDMPWALTQAVEIARQKEVGIIAAFEHLGIDGEYHPELPVKEKTFERMDEEAVVRLTGGFQRDGWLGKLIGFDFDSGRMSLRHDHILCTRPMRDGEWELPASVYEKIGRSEPQKIQEQDSGTQGMDLSM